MAKPKAQQPDNDIGHNSGNIGDDDLRVLFFMNRRKWLDAMAAKKAADARVKNVGKQVKADLGEHGLRQIKLYEQMRTPEGEAKAKAAMEADRQAARWAGLPVNTQVDMFEGLAPLDERAFADGEEAGLRGDTFANPYDENSVPGQRYEAGWKQGQAKLAEGFKKRQEPPAEIIKGEGSDGDDPFGDDDSADPSQLAAAE